MESKKLVLLATSLLVTAYLKADKIHDHHRPLIPEDNVVRSVMSGCSPATSRTDLDINNVRATILAGGDMWWDLIRGQYEVPKGSGVTSLFAGSLWIGGIDPGNNLKVAAMTYRQHGNDFWSGPLDATGATNSSTCLEWDKHFSVTRSEVETYLATGVASANILNWPTISADGQPMAPYFDADGSGDYNPMQGGDYPDFDMTGTRACNAQLKGDKAIWWVFNDKGNVHTETGGNSIGLEVHAQAFAFNTNDEINNMTFYKYQIINKSSFDVNKTYFGVWADADLGGAGDDYVGCDVSRGLGFCYNGDLVDDASSSGELTYGANPPAIGIDFFEGPKADNNGMADPIDSCANGIGYDDLVVDNERLGMSKFIYYTNGASSGQGDPTTAVEFYDYLSGLWKDGTPLTYGGTGHLSGGVNCDYMFPGDSDPTGYGTGSAQAPWDEFTSNNLPGDRRFLQSSGPFTLKAGSVNYVTTGVVWARATQGGNLASLALLKAADTKAQALFKSCFKLLDGPTAPDMAIQELNNQLIFSLSQNIVSNNNGENYSERDPYVLTGPDTLYKFEGYQVFQLKDATVSVNDIHNIDKARLVMQCDIKNEASQIINYVNDPTISSWVPIEEVNGANNGISHSFSITQDKFATGANTLVNHKQYYYMVIAYAYNSGELAANPYSSLTSNTPYLSGRKNIKVYTGIPHIPSPEEMGTIQNSAYGSGPLITRVEGQGNGGNILDITEETENRIVMSATGRVIDPTYQNGKGPVHVKVIDPLNVPLADFTIKFSGVTTAATWKMINNSTNEVVNSEKSILIANEQIIPQWGMSVTVNQVLPVGSASLDNGGFIDASMTFADPTKRWLSALKDEEGESNANWIRAGSVLTTGGGNTAFDDRYKPGTTVQFIDPQAKFEKILGGTWAPYALCAYTDAGMTSIAGPAVSNGGGMNILNDSLSFMSSVDIVITNDKSKWTRCPVLEMQEEPNLAEGGATKLELRKHNSVDKEGNENFGGADNNDFPTGMGWFPGYAINVETGERLNMAFGEDSWYVNENGRNMRWDPTANMYTSNYEPVFGGKHYIYVFGHNGEAHWSASDLLLPNELKDVPRYDKGAAIYKMLNAAAQGTTPSYKIKKNAVFSSAMWVNIPLLANGHQLRETDVKIRLRVAKPYAKAYSSRWNTSALLPSADTAVTPQNGNYPMYTFNTKGLQTVLSDAATAKDALGLINIVPNPYYAYSSYEKLGINTLVKITNLPVKCVVSIYTLNGTLVRKMRKQSDITSLDWDLKNDAGIPIASGMYIIHVDAAGIGEKTLKWFGVLRPQDLDSY